MRPLPTICGLAVVKWPLSPGRYENMIREIWDTWPLATVVSFRLNLVRHSTQNSWRFWTVPTFFSVENRFTVNFVIENWNLYFWTRHDIAIRTRLSTIFYVNFWPVNYCSDCKYSRFQKRVIWWQKFVKYWSKSQVATITKKGRTPDITTFSRKRVIRRSEKNPKNKYGYWWGVKPICRLSKNRERRT